MYLQNPKCEGMGQTWENQILNRYILGDFEVWGNFETQTPVPLDPFQESHVFLHKAIRIMQATRMRLGLKYKWKTRIQDTS